MSNSPNPRISCLLPVYNGEEFIEEAVRSILVQSCVDFELIVVDDGSTDATSGMLRTLAEADGRIRIIRQANGGIVPALNTGLAACRAAYVARMDADDVSMLDRFAFQADYLDQHPGCVLVGGIARSIALQNAAPQFATGGRHHRTDLAVFPPRIAVAMHPLIMVRTAALKAIGGYRSGYPHAEDYDLFIRLSALGTIDNPPKEVLFYRRHLGAVSIRNVDAQERSAVLAECDAIKAAGHSPIENWLMEPYARLRIFRRLQTIDIDRAGSLVGEAVQDLLRPSPTQLFSLRYLRLRAIIAFTLCKFVHRRVKASYYRVHDRRLHNV